VLVDNASTVPLGELPRARASSHSPSATVSAPRATSASRMSARPTSHSATADDETRPARSPAASRYYNASPPRPPSSAAASSTGTDATDADATRTPHFVSPHATLQASQRCSGSRVSRLHHVRHATHRRRTRRWRLRRHRPLKTGNSPADSPAADPSLHRRPRAQLPPPPQPSTRRPQTITPQDAANHIICSDCITDPHAPAAHRLIASVLRQPGKAGFTCRNRRARRRRTAP
jgi:hypothetical protein